MEQTTPTITETLKEYGRGIVGGLLFAFAPLYTMEIWWQGFLVPMHHLLIALVSTYLVLIAYAYYVGLHKHRTMRYNAAEALESLALGFGIAYVVLKLVGQLPPEISMAEFWARMTTEGLASAIGVAVGSSQLGGQQQEGDDAAAQDEQPSGMVHEIAYTTLGALLIIVGFVPTAEIIVIGVEAPPLMVLITALLSFLLALGMVHYMDFRGAQQLGEGVFAGGSVGDACVTYTVALIVSAALLWGVGRFEGVGLQAMLCMTVYLAWPATLGGAAARLLL